MTERPDRPTYTVSSIASSFHPGDPAAPWADTPSLRIGHYLWEANDYRPEVECRLCWSPAFLHVRFRVGEDRVRVRYARFQDPVYKDSCVELFIDAFPEKRLGYVNLETNAGGTLLAAFGPDRGNRRPLGRGELAGFEIVSSVAGPIDGEHGAREWSLEYRVPLALFHGIYGEEIRPGRRAAGNVYKCGDETEARHYGAWSRVETPTPDFHRPEYFGWILFA